MLESVANAIAAALVVGVSETTKVAVKDAYLHAKELLGELLPFFDQETAATTNPESVAAHLRTQLEALSSDQIDELKGEFQPLLVEMGIMPADADISGMVLEGITASEGSVDIELQDHAQHEGNRIFRNISGQQNVTIKYRTSGPNG